MYFTEKQFRIMKFIHQFRADRGISPTMEEIAGNLGVTKITIYDHLNQLERKGALKRERFRARSIELLVDLEDRPHPFTLPLAGEIPNGLESTERESSAQGADAGGAAGSENGGKDRSGQSPQTLDLNVVIPNNKQCFALRVQGDSMLDDHIRHGDYVIVERRSSYQNGDTVIVVLSNGQVVLRRYFLVKSRVRLLPCNERKKSSPSRAREGGDIKGVVVGLLRNFSPAPKN